MIKKKLQRRSWYSNAVAICCGVILYVLLTRFSSVWGGIKTFLGFFAPVLYGCIIAYMVNPLALFFRRRLFRGVKREALQKNVSNALAFLSILLFVALAAMLLVPQIAESVRTFSGNLDSYSDKLEAALNNRGLFGIDFNIDELVERITTIVSDYVRNNADRILMTSAATGRALIQWVIGFILAAYLLTEKDTLKAGFARLLRALVRTESFDVMAPILKRCDAILTRYIAFNLLDSAIVGVANAVFMLILRMPYAGLVSFIVAITNLIPTFGPVIGALIGAFVLVLVNPWNALAFLVFAAVLQGVDGYFLKPKLLGNSLGVSGLWILIAIILGGAMFGVAGILLAIPAVAILDFLYSDYFLPQLEARKARQESKKA